MPRLGSRFGAFWLVTLLVGGAHLLACTSRVSTETVAGQSSATTGTSAASGASGGSSGGTSGVATSGGSSSGTSGLIQSQVGEPCIHNADCASDYCAAVGGPLDAGRTGFACSEPCNGAGDCVPGWTCGPVPGLQSDYCLCTYSAQTCDGKDDYCDGVIDNEPAANESCAPRGASCQSGSCVCDPSVCTGDCCDGGCVNPSGDVLNCGGCGNACPFPSNSTPTCVDGSCGFVCLLTDAGALTGCGGACVNLNSDALNCGACGHSCLGGTCADGFCAVTTTVLLAQNPGSCTEFGGFALEAGTFYLSEDAVGNFGCSPPDGGEIIALQNVNGAGASVFSAPQYQPGQIIADAGLIVWADYGISGTYGGLDGGIVLAQIDGGSPRTVVWGIPIRAAIALDSENVYWVEGYPTGRVMRASLSDGTSRQIGQSYNPTAVTVDSSFVYWADRGNLEFSGEIMRAPIDGGSATSLATGQDEPTWVIVDSSNVYWLNSGGEIFRSLLDGGSPVPLATGLADPQFMLLDSSTLFVIDPGGGIGEVSTDGGPVLWLVDGGGSGWPALDSTTFYWATESATNALVINAVPR